MRSPYTQLYLHIVWATWDRLPLITEQVKPRLYAAIAAKCHELKCVPLAIGGIADHVHLLVRLHTTVAAATLAKEVKGASSHLVTHEITPDQFFKWQGSYGAFTLRKSETPNVQAYIERQAEHHAAVDLWEEGNRLRPKKMKTRIESGSPSRRRPTSRWLLRFPTAENWMNPHA